MDLLLHLLEDQGQASLLEWQNLLQNVFNTYLNVLVPLLFKVVQFVEKTLLVFRRCHDASLFLNKLRGA